MGLQIKDTTWKTPTNIWIKDSGVWKKVFKVFIKDTTWKDVYTATLYEGTSEQYGASAGGSETITTSGTSGTITIPAGVRRISVDLKGAGGGAGPGVEIGGIQVTSPEPTGGAGGVGGRFEFSIYVTPGDTFNWAIGAAGSPNYSGITEVLVNARPPISRAHDGPNNRYIYTLDGNDISSEATRTGGSTTFSGTNSTWNGTTWAALGGAGGEGGYVQIYQYTGGGGGGGAGPDAAENGSAGSNGGTTDPGVSEISQTQTSGGGSAAATAGSIVVKPWS